MRKLPRVICSQIDHAIEELAELPRPTSVKKLAGGKGWRIRIGDYRVIYDIDDTARTITIGRVMHRREVYRW